MGFLESIWRSAGIAPGMGVLDVGGGVGDTAFLTDGRPPQRTFCAERARAWPHFIEPELDLRFVSDPSPDLALTRGYAAATGGGGPFTITHHHLTNQLPFRLSRAHRGPTQPPS